MKNDNSAELFPVVDECGNIIGSATRGECHGGKMLLHPVVHLHLFDASGNLYLQHRPAWKDIQPDKWDTAVGGHIDLGESVEMALHRETLEELGISDCRCTETRGCRGIGRDRFRTGIPAQLYILQRARTGACLCVPNGI